MPTLPAAHQLLTTGLQAYSTTNPNSSSACPIPTDYLLRVDIIAADSSRPGLPRHAEESNVIGSRELNTFNGRQRLSRPTPEWIRFQFHGCRRQPDRHRSYDEIVIGRNEQHT
ncbi:BQ5605_C008g05391 [Microbotryum silenes-dioicae]|uniref:BQ5605_C008g05391 protein n=1 Tax=Microbotryum silenes-dioicae TaxID=796604 RepID=A0A2X0MHN7_9BASI|nr:BQ5605_C008g05391 [Microbotryum silenes-dioicae]